MQIKASYTHFKPGFLNRLNLPKAEIVFQIDGEPHQTNRGNVEYVICYIGLFLLYKT